MVNIKRPLDVVLGATNNFKKNITGTPGGRLHTQQPRIRISVLSIFLQLKYRAQHRENAA